MAAYRELCYATRLPIRSLFSPKQRARILMKGAHAPGRYAAGNLLRRCSTSNSGKQTFNQTKSNYSTSQEADEPFSSEEEQSEESDTAAVRQLVLNSALEFVPAFGWSVDALSEGARAEGLPGVAHGMFPRGGGDLVHHFVKECNAQLAEKLAREVQEETAEEEQGGKRGRRAVPLIRDALEARLRMIIPFIEQWPQAMALMVVPSNTKEHFSNLSQLMDDIWYHAGDRSVDFNWYTKRVALLAIYKSAELTLVQDKSTDFQETWMFIDRRLADFSRMYKLRSDIDHTVGSLSSLMTAAYTVGRNVAGVNNRNR
ncbi:ubiquinone biosynthesis protein COQ9-B, mitochondrial-like [Asterias rubens]|uniref:ubiquinone biosynthesis protein COQ9-B, mitochondrial-like n=1 Tax=Asterias rubens TaxID=7604 RepID=UPI001455401D|nr:ubiquinone biosynthesis protein COQ9-B, mitochondrial-like [Asterias rubens]